MVNEIRKDILSMNGKNIDNLELIREKWGVYVYRCTYDGNPAVVKYFANGTDKREINNYCILNKYNIPTIKVLAYGKSSIVMENISVSDDWRLGIKEDLHDADVANCLAHWYFDLHEKGSGIFELNAIESDFDKVTESTLTMLCEELPEIADTFKYILYHYKKLRELINEPSCTLTYNDFYYTNLIVRKDNREAFMFDYNMLGRGYRYSDIRNVCWSLQNEAYTSFVNKYKQLYKNKYGEYRTSKEAEEKKIDVVMDELHGLILAFERKNYSKLKEFAKKELAEKILLKNTQKLFE